MSIQKDRGLFHKFKVSRVDCTDGPGRKHDNCDYFVLDMTHDPHAVDALRGYAASCEETLPRLAQDLRTRADRLEHDLAHESAEVEMVIDIDTLGVPGIIKAVSPHAIEDEHEKAHFLRLRRFDTLDQVREELADTTMRYAVHSLKRLPVLGGGEYYQLNYAKWHVAAPASV